MHKTLTILERLCAFDTTSHKSNLECIGYCSALLTEAGFEVRTLPNAEGTKTNLHAIAGPKDRQALVLAGHTDVVPVVGQEWATDPFRLTQAGERLTARGAADMKGFLATVLSVATTLDHETLRAQLHLILTYDEETGCFGARDICDYLRAAIPARSFCLVGEPTDLQPIVAHKGVKGFRATITGSEGHAATIASKTNAIHFASDLVQYLLRQAEDYSAHLSGGDYVTPYSTIQVGLINGGLARNMIAKQCEMDFEFRYVPEDSADAFSAGLETFLQSNLRPRLTENNEQASADIQTLSHVPAFKSDVPGNFLEILCAVLQSSSCGCWDGVTEAGYYLNAGLDAIVCGPGSILQAHQPNECVSVSALKECEDFLYRLVSNVTGH